MYTVLSMEISQFQWIYSLIYAINECIWNPIYTRIDFQNHHLNSQIFDNSMYTKFAIRMGHMKHIHEGKTFGNIFNRIQDVQMLNYNQIDWFVEKTRPFCDSSILQLICTFLHCVFFYTIYLYYFITHYIWLIHTELKMKYLFVLISINDEFGPEIHHGNYQFSHAQTMNLLSFRFSIKWNRMWTSILEKKISLSFILTKSIKFLWNKS